jgi:hypothetical protein
MIKTSGFWPHVRARALRAPVFLSSLPPQTGRCAPPPAYAASLLLIRPLKIYKIYRTWAAHVKGFFLSTGPCTEDMKYEVPCPPSYLFLFFSEELFFVFLFFSSYICYICCITDMHINDIPVHIFILLRGFSRRPNLFLSIWGPNLMYLCDHTS